MGGCVAESSNRGGSTRGGHNKPTSQGTSSKLEDKTGEQEHRGTGAQEHRNTRAQEHNRGPQQTNLTRHNHREFKAGGQRGKEIMGAFSVSVYEQIAQV